jgi:hypothetical protein
MPQLLNIWSNQLEYSRIVPKMLPFSFTQKYFFENLKKIKINCSMFYLFGQNLLFNLETHTEWPSQGFCESNSHNFNYSILCLTRYIYYSQHPNTHPHSKTRILKPQHVVTQLDFLVPNVFTPYSRHHLSTLPSFLVCRSP